MERERDLEQELELERGRGRERERAAYKQKAARRSRRKRGSAHRRAGPLRDAGCRGRGGGEGEVSGTWARGRRVVLGREAPGVRLGGPAPLGLTAAGCGAASERGSQPGLRLVRCLHMLLGPALHLLWVLHRSVRCLLRRLWHRGRKSRQLCHWADPPSLLHCSWAAALQLPPFVFSFLSYHSEHRSEQATRATGGSRQQGGRDGGGDNGEKRRHFRRCALSPPLGANQTSNSPSSRRYGEG